MLGVPGLYKRAMGLLGGKQAKIVHVSRYIRARSGDRVLDVGCGPAEILDYLPDVDYLGIDIDENYISSAKMRYGARAKFLCKDVARLPEDNLKPFDIVVATGLLHHLNDDECINLLSHCHKLLKPAGRMITLDGCRTLRQHPVDAWMLNNDRGKFVRTKDAYERLAMAVFPGVEISLRSDLLRIPYTLAIMELKLTANHAKRPSLEQEALRL